MRKRLLLIGGSVLGLAIISALLELSLTGGGGGTVSGRAEPTMPGSILGTGTITHVRTPLDRMMPATSDFPPPYDAVVPPPTAVAGAALDLTGIGAASSVNPGTCAPPSQRFGADQTALVVGTDDATSATITVELYRVDKPLTSRRDQLTHCSQATVTTDGAAATLTTRLQPPPASIDADDVLAVDQTLKSRGAGLTQRRNLTTLLAQIGDVRVQATAMSFGGPSPDLIGGGGDTTAQTAALNTLFAATVARVRQG